MRKYILLFFFIVMGSCPVFSQLPGGGDCSPDDEGCSDEAVPLDSGTAILAGASILYAFHTFRKKHTAS